MNLAGPLDGGRSFLPEWCFFTSETQPYDGSDYDTVVQLTNTSTLLPAYSSEVLGPDSFSLSLSLSLCVCVCVHQCGAEHSNQTMSARPAPTSVCLNMKV